MKTFIDVQNEVLQFGFNDGPQVNRARVKDWINEAQQRIARQVEGPEFQTNVNVALVNGQAVYPLPTDFARIQDLSYPLYGYRLQSVDIQDYDLMVSTMQQLSNPTRYTLDQFNLMPAQKTAVMKRDWNTLLEYGGVSYALAKLAFTDQHSYQYMAAEMTGMSQQGYLDMMLAGGRSIEGWRSKKERGEA